jgi:predicted DNA-binding transcriptional regulator AlpA
MKQGTVYGSDTQCSDTLAVSRATFRRWTARPGFPQPVRLGPNTVRWNLQAVLDWAEAQAAVCT